MNLTTGLSKGFADTDHPDGDWRFVNGDWGTGLIVGTTISGLTSSKCMALSFSVGYEYNLTEREPDLSFDVSVGYVFCDDRRRPPSFWPRRDSPPFRSHG